MRTNGRISKLAAAVAMSAASLLFFLWGIAGAGEQHARVDAVGNAGSAPGVEESSAKSQDYSADNYPMCGKCHSACEDGRTHAGLLPVGTAAGAALPVDAEGRTTCVTCHDPGRHEEPGVAGGHLRISNLRRELCLACHRQENEAGPRVEIVSPLERTLVREEHLALIGRASRLSGSDLILRLNGAEFHLQVTRGKFSTWLKLQDGVNRIEIAHQERLLWQGEVFYGPNPLNSYKLASSGHRTGNREQCLECHRSGDGTRTGVAGSASPVCYGCHERNDDKRYVHGPLAVGDCLACHDPHGGYGAAHLRKEQGLLCGNCHATREKTSTVACNGAGEGCVDCHDPHQSDTRYLLKGPQYTMR